MVGLLVIVVLLLFIGMIFLRFYLIKPGKLLPDIRKNVEVTDMLTAIMKYTFNGKGMGENIAECEEKGDCDKINGEISKILKKINKEGNKYGFMVIKNEKLLFSVKNECEVGLVSNFPIVKGEDYYEARLIFC